MCRTLAFLNGEVSILSLTGDSRMADVYRVEVTPKAQKQLRRIPKGDRERIELAIASLADNARPEGNQKMQGMADTYRILVGKNRVIYVVSDLDLLVLVIVIGHRKDVYRKK